MPWGLMLHYSFEAGLKACSTLSYNGIVALVTVS
jgi:hypothetical protein